MKSYIEHLMMCGFNAVRAYNIARDFLREGDEKGLEQFISEMEADQRWEHGNHLTIILLDEAELGIVPSER